LRNLGSAFIRAIFFIAFECLYRFVRVNIPGRCLNASPGIKWSENQSCVNGVTKREDKRLEENNKARFEQVVLPHLDAAYNLARWLTRNDHDAQDIVQEAYMRAFRFFDGFRGGDSRSWLLTIVRNTCYTWIKQNRAHELTTAFDEDIHSMESDGSNPEMVLLENVDNQLLRQALEELPVEFREIVVLRDLEGLSYKEIARVADLPVGTVMSRLARARKRLEQGLADRVRMEV
jgi:RNA polymerase sigma-70 factor, ECF subfamily